MPTTRAAEKDATAGGGHIEREGGIEGAGSKHKIPDEPSLEPKRSKTLDDKTQQTMEDTMPSPTEAYGNGYAISQSKEEPEVSKEEDQNGHSQEQKADTADTVDTVDMADTADTADMADTADTADKTDRADETDREDKTDRADKTDKADKTDRADTDTDTTEEHGARKGAVPSSILEKGIIYFFIRGRVGIDEPSDVCEIRRSYMILRPLGKDSKIGEGTVRDAGNIRLIAVPKKVFPRSGRDRWIAFVEKSHATLATLKEEFLPSSDYETKTAGARHSPAAKPAAEGVYAITTTGRESHLAYVITLPSELGELQAELGLRRKGSFIISTRNPQYDAPRGTALPKGPEYPKDVQDEFRTLRWAPSRPHHLDYVNTQFLLVGESSGIAKATEPLKGDKEEEEKEGKAKPEEELEKLEDEDTHRMEALRDDDSAAVFADLGVFGKDYPTLDTTF